MAKKNNNTGNASAHPSYKVTVESSMVALSSLVISFAYNESRKGISSNGDLLGLTKGKSPVVAQASQELLKSMLSPRGFETVEIIVTTPLPKVDVRVHQEEEARRTEEMSTLPLFKGEKALFTYKGVEVELTHEMIAKEWALTFPLEIKGKPRVQEGSEAVMSGNRRTTVLILRNAIVRAAGFEQDIVSEVRREVRVYESVRARKDDSILMNERGKQGKQESTKTQKLAASKDLIENGGTQSELNAVFAGNRGVVQLNYEICAGLRIVSWADKVSLGGEEMSGRDAAQAHWDYLLSPGATLPNQGRLARMRAYRLMSEHDNGLSDEFASKGPGIRKAFGLWTEHHLGRNNIAAFKKHVKANPSITQSVSDYFLAIRDGDWVDPVTGKVATTSSLASTTLQAVAAKYDDKTEEGKLLESLLNVAAGADNSQELGDVASALMAHIKELKAFLCYLRDSKGEITGEPITQDQFDAIVAKAKTRKRA